MSALSAEVNLFHANKREYVCSTERDKQNRIDWLLNSFKQAKESQREAICIELDTLFETRRDWSKRAGKVYLFAIASGFIVNNKTVGWYRGKPAKPKAPLPKVMAISQARDALHKHCKAKNISMVQEICMGEMLTSRARNGENIDTVLNQILGET